MSRSEKQQFYRSTVRYHEASCRLYGVDAVVHLENDSDRWFWQQVFEQFRPGRRYRFIGASMSAQGNMTSGCGMCLKYRRYLSQRFFVCIDSDLRHLLDREPVAATQGIMQTYTYSWENHALLATKLQRDYDALRHVPPFNFISFMRRYSDIVYEPMLLMLWSEKGRRGVYSARRFNEAITMTEQHDDERRDGRLFLQRLSERLAPARAIIERRDDFDLQREAAYYGRKGLHRHDAYLYVRGHCIYNALRFMGRRLIGQRFDRLLYRDLILDGYIPAHRLRHDIMMIDRLPPTSRRR